LDVTLARAAKGDGASWRVLVDQYSRRVFALVVRSCGDRELAEEITQATFVKLVGQLGKYNERGRFEPWLFRIAMNQLRDEMRRRKRQARPMDMSGSAGDEDRPWAAVEGELADGSGSRGEASARGAGGEGEEPFEAVSRAEQVERLKRAIASLGPDDREVLNLRHTAGLSFAEIARTLDEPLGTVLARGHRALGKLRKLMEESAD
jgi:RNA polymerase sigma-70 factor (ECF subfamily)